MWPLSSNERSSQQVKSRQASRDECRAMSDSKLIANFELMRVVPADGPRRSIRVTRASVPEATCYYMFFGTFSVM